MKVSVDVDVEVLGLDGERSIPGLWEEIATVNSPHIGMIGRSAMGGTGYHLFAPDGADTSSLPNGSYVGVISVHDAILSIIKQWPSLVERAREEVDP